MFLRIANLVLALQNGDLDQAGTNAANKGKETMQGDLQFFIFIEIKVLNTLDFKPRKLCLVQFSKNQKKISV